MHTTFGFTGQREDTQAPGSSGLDYFHARYYDPVIGRFTTADPTRPDLGSPRGTDAYGYVGGRVENATDPSGHGLIQWENRDGIALGRDPGNISPMNIQTLKDMGQFLFGAESIHDDLRAMMDNKASLQTKVAAAQDLANNVELDLLMVIGVGEEIRAADMGADVARSADAAARTVDDAARTTRRVDDVVHTCGEECPPHVDDPHSTSPTTDPTNPGPEKTPGGCSFSADTMVATPQGERAIGSLKVGDRVNAYNTTSGQAEAETVQHVWINHDQDLVDVHLLSASTAAPTPGEGRTRAERGRLAGDETAIRIHGSAYQATNVDGGETIHTTANHPWLTADRGWVPAGDLQPDEAVVTLPGAIGTVAWVHTVRGQADMYNLTVAHDHTYAVGSGRYVVHNTCGGGSGRSTEAMPGGAGGSGGEANTVELYRAVGVREYNSVKATGKFLPGSNSLEGRQFALSLDDALAYAGTDTSKVAILRATIHGDALGAFDFSRDIDPSIFKQGVVTVQPWQSDFFHEALIFIAQVV